MNQKEKELLKKIANIEGTKKLKENPYWILNKKYMKLFFESHKACARSMILNSPCYEQCSVMHLNPSFMEDYLTRKYMINIIIYERKLRGIA